MLVQLVIGRANFNAGMCKKLGIGTDSEPARARAFFRAGADRMDAKSAFELAEYHLEADFAHACPATGASSTCSCSCSSMSAAASAFATARCTRQCFSSLPARAALAFAYAPRLVSHVFYTPHA